MPRPTRHTGDDGKTGILGPGRLPKYHMQIEALGSLDEASAAIGLARACCQHPENQETLKAVQRDLYSLMAELATTTGSAAQIKGLEPARLEWLEDQTRCLEEATPLPGGFILPGDTLSGAAFSLARTSVRRAERRAAELIDSQARPAGTILQYLNRLSTLLFLLELQENLSAGQSPSLARQ